MSRSIIYPNKFYLTEDEYNEYFRELSTDEINDAFDSYGDSGSTQCFLFNFDDGVNFEYSAIIIFLTASGTIPLSIPNVKNDSDFDRFLFTAFCSYDDEHDWVEERDGEDYPDEFTFEEIVKFVDPEYRLELKRLLTEYGVVPSQPKKKKSKNIIIDYFSDEEN